MKPGKFKSYSDFSGEASYLGAQFCTEVTERSSFHVGNTEDAYCTFCTVHAAVFLTLQSKKFIPFLETLLDNRRISLFPLSFIILH